MTLGLKTQNNRWIIDGKCLRQVREALDLTLQEFGKECGWSRQYQSRLELGALTVNTEAMNCIVDVCSERGFKVFRTFDALVVHFARS